MTKIKYFYTIVFVAFLSLSMNGMNLFVQTPNNGTISLDVEPSDSGENVKAKIFDQISVPVINQVLTWNGTTIQDNQTLADVGIVTNNSSIVLTVTTTTQVPEKMSYQAVVRNTTNNLVTNQPVGMQISILQGSSTGTAVYVETQTPTSNANGLVSLEIGGGTVVSGNMATINWANGPYFIKTETDPTGGSSYTITGTSQLLSAPYALYAKTSGSSTPGPIGPQGPQGPAGANGLDGATGPAGTNGTNGVGVPVGGTTGQVLAKVDGTDYNTQWVTPSGGTSLPAQTGNAGKVLTTDGTNPSWTNAPILGTLQVSPVTSGGTTNVTVSNLNVRNIMLDYQGGNGNASGTIINIIVPSAASYPAGTILTFSSTNTITTSPLTVGNYTFTSPNSTITAHVANNVSTANAVTLTNNGASGVLNVITDGVSKWYRIN